MTKRSYSKPRLERRDSLAAIAAQAVVISPVMVDN